MKKISFLMVMVLSIFISASASAYTVKSTADIQAFFGSTGSNSQDKLKDTINALNFHATRIQGELTNPVATSTERAGLLIPQISDSFYAGTLPAGTSTAIFGIDFFATGTPMTVDRVTLQIKVKSNGIEENPGSFIKSLSVIGGKNPYHNLPVDQNTFIKDTTSIPGQVVYTVQLSSLAVEVLSGSGTSKRMMVYANLNPISADREVTVSVFGPQGIRALDSRNRESFYGLAGVKNFTFKPLTPTGTSTATTTPSSLLVTSVNASSTGKMAYVTWKTNNPSDSKVLYGTTTGSYFASKMVSESVVNHAVTINLPAEGVRYYYVVESRDSAGGVARSKEYMINPTAKMSLIDFLKKMTASVSNIFGR